MTDNEANNLTRPGYVLEPLNDRIRDYFKRQNNGAELSDTEINRRRHKVVEQMMQISARIQAQKIADKLSGGDKPH